MYIAVKIRIINVYIELIFTEVIVVVHSSFQCLLYIPGAFDKDFIAIVVDLIANANSTDTTAHLSERILARSHFQGS
jgi:hypothetical protein